MVKKVLLKYGDDNVLPITRGELVLDSSGKLALHSSEFLANDDLPGLTTIHYVSISKKDDLKNEVLNVHIVQLKSSSEEVYPVTSADAVIVNTDTGNNSLTDVLKEIRVEIGDSKIVLDDRPTEGNTTHGVSSDGIFQELQETVGNIQILLQSV